MSDTYVLALNQNNNRENKDEDFIQESFTIFGSLHYFYKLDSANTVNTSN